jgi:hypothetical protein
MISSWYLPTVKTLYEYIYAPIITQYWTSPHCITLIPRFLPTTAPMIDWDDTQSLMAALPASNNDGVQNMLLKIVALVPPYCTGTNNSTKSAPIVKLQRILLLSSNATPMTLPLLEFCN